MLYLRILSANLFVLVLLWTYRILPYFLLEYRVLNFNCHFARAVCSPFQGVFIVLFRTTYVCLRNSTTSLLPFFFFFLISSWLGQRLSTPSPFFLRTRYIHLRYLTVSSLLRMVYIHLRNLIVSFLLRTMYIHLRNIIVFFFFFFKSK